VTALPTLQAALDWLEKHWDGRNPPFTLNVHDTDGELGGLRFSLAFERYLDAHPCCASPVKGNGRLCVCATDEERTVTCAHPTLAIGRSEKDCAECFGSGVKTTRHVQWRWPMWRAVTKLQNALRPRNEPHPYALILVLARYGWQPKSAARELGLPWDYAEASFLRAIRQLHGRYEEAPVDTRRSTTHAAAWTELSVSQQNAIMGGETAA